MSPAQDADYVASEPKIDPHDMCGRKAQPSVREGLGQSTTCKEDVNQ